MNSISIHRSVFGRVAQVVVALLVAFSFVSAAKADIIFHQGAGAVQPEENVLFNNGTLLDAGMTVQGITNISSWIANFTSVELLQTPANGQARIVASDGLLASLDFSLDQHLPFTEFEFNVRIPNNSGPAPSFTLTVIDTDGGIHVSQGYTLGNGSNFFSIESRNGHRMRQVLLSASSQIITQFSQFRVTAIPEPGTGLVLVAATAICLLRFGRRR